jgi:hypothetical protein
MARFTDLETIVMTAHSVSAFVKANATRIGANNSLPDVIFKQKTE